MIDELGAAAAQRADRRNRTAPAPAAFLRAFRTHLTSLAVEVDHLRCDEGFRATLETMSRVGRYSPTNQ
jgi:hypothetical protein